MKKKLKWYHSFPKLKIRGEHEVPLQEEIIAGLIPDDLTGKTVLDLGAWDGYYSFLAAERNAEVVVAIDTGEAEKRTMDGDEHTLYEKYEYLKKKIKPNVHFIMLDVMDIDKIKMDFDIILCFGIYYHLKDPYTFFEKCFKKCKEMLLIEGQIIYKTEPLAVVFDEGELSGDPTNYWAFSPGALVKLLKRIGFKTAEYIKFEDSFDILARGLFIARK